MAPPLCAEGADPVAPSAQPRSSWPRQQSALPALPELLLQVRALICVAKCPQILSPSRSRQHFSISVWEALLGSGAHVRETIALKAKMLLARLHL